MGITIQCGILTRVYISRAVYISSTRAIAIQEGVKIQQREQNSTAKEGHNSTKNQRKIH